MKHQRALCNAAVTKHSNYTIIKIFKKNPTTFFSLFHLSNLHLTATSEPTTNMSLLPLLPRSQSDWAQHCSLTHLIPVLRLLWLTPKPKNRDTTGSQASETPEVFFLFGWFFSKWKDTLKSRHHWSEGKESLKDTDDGGEEGTPEQSSGLCLLQVLHGQITEGLRANLYITAESTTAASCCLPCAGITAAVHLLCSVILTVVTEGSLLSRLATVAGPSLLCGAQAWGGH